MFLRNITQNIIVLLSCSVLCTGSSIRAAFTVRTIKPMKAVDCSFFGAQIAHSSFSHNTACRLSGSLRDRERRNKLWALWEERGRGRKRCGVTSLCSAAEGAQKNAQIRNADADAVAVIVGGSRGIGLAMVQVLTTSFKGRIFATGRRPQDATALQSIVQAHPDRVHAISLDVCDEASVEAAAAAIRVLSGGRVDLVVNTAGVLHDVSEPGSHGRNMPERQLKDITEDWLTYNLKVNTLGPVWVAKHMQDMLETRGPRAQGAPPRPTSVLATLSARVGSISDNHLGGWYRCASLREYFSMDENNVSCCTV
jgi:hypothetical protein